MRTLTILLLACSIGRAGTVAIDQINPPMRAPSLVGTFDNDPTFGQTFTPTEWKHVGVDLYLQVLNDPVEYPPVPIDLELRYFDPSGQAIEGTQVTVTPTLSPDRTPGWVTFDFAQPIGLEVGQQYFIALFTTSPRWATWETGVDADYFARGAKYQQGHIVPIYDLVFRTRVEVTPIPLPAPLWSGLVLVPVALLLSRQLRLLAKVG